MSDVHGDHMREDCAHVHQSEHFTRGFNDALWGAYHGQPLKDGARFDYDAGHAVGTLERIANR